jgi:hypothetical protein
MAFYSIASLATAPGALIFDLSNPQTVCDYSCAPQFL